MPKTVVITGPESTGKSSLATWLASDLNAVYVDEMARGYLESLSRPYDQNDMHRMAALQLEAQLSAIQNTSTLVVCDTDLLTFIIWWEVKFGDCPQEWVEKWKANLPDAYMLMDIDLPWQEDPLREHPDRRQELKDRYLDKLHQIGTPFRIISGDGPERNERAKKSLEELL
ncbi:MAG: ATP-binding protein [Flavobacteriia bacterium]|nr:ATP-binding protein [Flavobacteriia bacterium]